MHEVAEAGYNAIKKSTGREYKYGSISSVTKRIFSGTVVDYAFGVINVPFCLVMELPNSKYGFQPPTDHIESITEESWIGIKAMCYQSLSCFEKVLFIPQKLFPQNISDAENNNQDFEIKNLNYNLKIVSK